MVRKIKHRRDLFAGDGWIKGKKLGDGFAPLQEVEGLLVKGICGQVPGSVIPGMMGMEAGGRTFAYDEAGNKTEEISYNEDGTLGTKAVFTREYDEHANWTKETVSMASSWDAELKLSTPAHVTHRVITYW